METENAYPECEKMRAVSEVSNQIGWFLDWLEANGIMLARRSNEFECWCFGVLDEDGDECERCDGTGTVTSGSRTHLVGYHEGFEHLLARYFEIDLDKVEAERRAMLDAMRADRLAEEVRATPTTRSTL